MTKAPGLGALQRAGSKGFPGLVGLVVTAAGNGRASARLEVTPRHRAPNGYLHAGAILALADSACGYGCLLSLPPGATNFTTIELKANFLGAARGPVLRCEAERIHGGRSTQVWDAELTDADGRIVALFRCTQLLLAAPVGSDRPGREDAS